MLWVVSVLRTYLEPVTPQQNSSLDSGHIMELRKDKSCWLVPQEAEPRKPLCRVITSHCLRMLWGTISSSIRTQALTSPARWSTGYCVVQYRPFPELPWQMGAVSAQVIHGRTWKEWETWAKGSMSVSFQKRTAYSNRLHLPHTMSPWTFWYLHQICVCAVGLSLNCSDIYFSWVLAFSQCHQAALWKVCSYLTGEYWCSYLYTSLSILGIFYVQLKVSKQ